MRIYDKNGLEREWAWLVSEFGDVEVGEMLDAGWYVAELRESVGPAALVVSVRTESGQLARGIPVAFYWPDAPIDHQAGPANGLPDAIIPGRAIMGTTNERGDVGFGLGGGAYYWPPNGGPHAVWMYGRAVRSQVVSGLGMVGGTDHRHLDVVFQWRNQAPGPTPPEPEPPDPDPPVPEPDPEPEPDPPVDFKTAVLQKLDRIIEILLSV